MSTIHLIRHAKAKNRLTWEEPDHLRPLTKRGRREALAIAARLGEEPVARLVSSPFVRCVQTLEPLALALELPIETTDELAEGAGGERRGRAPALASRRRVRSRAARTATSLFEIVDLVARSGVSLDGPAEAPVASSWVLDVEDGRFVRARFVDQPPR